MVTPAGRSEIASALKALNITDDQKKVNQNYTYHLTPIRMASLKTEILKCQTDMKKLDLCAL